MTHYIEAVHMSRPGNSSHEHIAEVKWRNGNTQETGHSATAAMVKFINDGNDVWVSDRRGTVSVGVVNASPPYLRTYADGRPTDNLLSLPRY